MRRRGKFDAPGPGRYEWPISDGVVERFRAKVEKRGLDDCWPWLAFKNPAGYGMIRNGHHMALSNRLAWVIEKGRIPKGKHVLHSCDNPACCNVRHLRVGTNADNMRDKVARGRCHTINLKTRGENHWQAKLTWDQVNEIRSRSTRKRGEGKRFAEEYGVSRATITNVLKGKVWNRWEEA